MIRKIVNFIRLTFDWKFMMLTIVCLSSCSKLDSLKKFQFHKKFQNQSFFYQKLKQFYQTFHENDTPYHKSIQSLPCMSLYFIVSFIYFPSIEWKNERAHLFCLHSATSFPVDLISRYVCLLLLIEDHWTTFNENTES